MKEVFQRERTECHMKPVENTEGLGMFFTTKELFQSGILMETQLCVLTHTKAKNCIFK